MGLVTVRGIRATKVHSLVSRVIAHVELESVAPQARILGISRVQFEATVWQRGVHAGILPVKVESSIRGVGVEIEFHSSGVAARVDV